MKPIRKNRPDVDFFRGDAEIRVLWLGQRLLLADQLLPSRLMFSTARMQLRKIAATDLDDLLALDSDPEVLRYLRTPGAPMLTRDDYSRPGGFLERMMAYDDEPHGFFRATEDGRFLGWFHLRPSVFESKILELGYRLRREAWGRGLATEGSRVLCQHAFATLAQTSVDACADPQNLGSIAVMKKLGMQYVSTQPHPRALAMNVDRYMVSREGFRNADV